MRITQHGRKRLWPVLLNQHTFGVVIATAGIVTAIPEYLNFGTCGCDHFDRELDRAITSSGGPLPARRLW